MTTIHGIKYTIKDQEVFSNKTFLGTIPPYQGEKEEIKLNWTLKESTSTQEIDCESLDGKYELVAVGGSAPSSDGYRSGSDSRYVKRFIPDTFTASVEVTTITATNQFGETLKFSSPIDPEKIATTLKWQPGTVKLAPPTVNLPAHRIVFNQDAKKEKAFIKEQILILLKQKETLEKEVLAEGQKDMTEWVELLTQLGKNPDWVEKEFRGHAIITPLRQGLLTNPTPEWNGFEWKIGLCSLTPKFLERIKSELTALAARKKPVRR